MQIHCTAAQGQDSPPWGREYNPSRSACGIKRCAGDLLGSQLWHTVSSGIWLGALGLSLLGIQAFRALSTAVMLCLAFSPLFLFFSCMGGREISQYQEQYPLTHCNTAPLLVPGAPKTASSCLWLSQDNQSRHACWAVRESWSAKHPWTSQNIHAPCFPLFLWESILLAPCQIHLPYKTKELEGGDLRLCKTKEKRVN